MFHLSLPVTDFARCVAFYRDCFEARVTMLNEKAANVYVFGAQVTFHDDPGSTISVVQRQEMHFGYVASDEEWYRLQRRVENFGQPILKCLRPDAENSVRGKLLVVDPSGNVVEINSGLCRPGSG